MLDRVNIADAAIQSDPVRHGGGRRLTTLKDLKAAYSTRRLHAATAADPRTDAIITADHPSVANLDRLLPDPLINTDVAPTQQQTTRVDYVIKMAAEEPGSSEKDKIGKTEARQRQLHSLATVILPMKTSPSNYLHDLTLNDSEYDQ